jgi:hypothetical protein
MQLAQPKVGWSGSNTRLSTSFVVAFAGNVVSITTHLAALFP